MDAELSSGDLARATGCTLRTVRFYEEQGLLRPAHLSGGGHRRYTAADLERLRLISDLRQLGLPLAEIRAALDLSAGCRTGAEFSARFSEVLVAHIRQAEQRLACLRRVKRELEAALEAIQDSHPGAKPRCLCELGEAASPRIVKLLARGGSCQHHPEADRTAGPPGRPWVKLT